MKPSQIQQSRGVRKTVTRFKLCIRSLSLQRETTQLAGNMGSLLTSLVPPLISPGLDPPIVSYFVEQNLCVEQIS